MNARLYVIPGSHPSMTARLLLERKGIAYKRVDLSAPIHKRIVRMLGFPGDTVPALKLDGRRIQGSREIASELERVRPEPRLFPSDPARRALVEDAERWGDEELQPRARRMAWWALERDPKGVRSFIEGAHPGVPLWFAARTAGPFVRASARQSGATDQAVEADVAAVPGLLDHIDALIAGGVLDGDELTAADYQIAPGVCLLRTFDDLRPSIEARPAGRPADRVVASYPGRIPPVLPSEWLVARTPEVVPAA